MNEHRRTWGFRLSGIDVAIVLLTIPATWLAWRFIDHLAVLIPMVVGHFFLFCNIFRIIRWKELLWTAVFLLNVTTWVIVTELWANTPALTWVGILSFQIPLTVLLIVTELFTPRYHGIWARRLNVHLDDYLAGRDFS